MADDDFIDIGNFTVELYSPSKEVKELHGFYHHGSSDFDPEDSEYQKSVGGFWVATIFIGLIVLMFAWTLNLCSCFVCFQQRCLKHCMFGGTRGRMGVSLMLLVSAIVITTSYFGYTSLVDASEGLGDVMTDLADVFRVMEDASVVLTQQEWEFKDSIDEMSCPSIVSNTTMDGFYSASGMLFDMLDGFANDIEKKSEIMTETLPSTLGLGIGFIVASYWLLAFLGIIAITTHNTCDDKCFLLLTSLVMLGFVVFLGFELMFAVSIADFCYAGPLNSIDTLAEANLDGEQVDIVHYYTQCEGTLPFIPQLKNLTTALNDASDALSSSQTSLVCDTDGVTGFQAASNASVDAIYEIAEAMACNSINPIFVEATYDYLCGDFVKGLSRLWAAQVVATIFLYLGFVGFPCATSAPEAYISPEAAPVDQLKEEDL